MNKIIAFLSLIFITQFAMADYITQNTNNGCVDGIIGIDNNNHSNMLAVFEPNQYTCPSGQYLPANTDGCRTCPANGTCNGGTFIFNEKESQGITFSFPFTQSQINSCVNDVIGADSNNHSTMYAIFTPNTITVNWDDGTNTIQNTCVYGDEITIPPAPTRPGYVFNGWRVKQNNTN